MVRVSAHPAERRTAQHGPAERIQKCELTVTPPSKTSSGCRQALLCILPFRHSAALPHFHDTAQDRQHLEEIQQLEGVNEAKFDSSFCRSPHS